MEKVIKDGNVAVLISTGYGAGFFSWGAPLEAIYDPTLVNLVLEDKMDDAAKYVEEKWPDAYSGGVHDLTVVWLKEGTRFLIEEYDGAESIHVYNEEEYLTA